MNIFFEQIPQELKELPNWVCWALETRGGKTTKIPYTPETGQKARANNPKTWTGFKEAAECLVSYDGIGFQFGESPFVGIDLDHCLKGGTVSPEAQQIIDALDSYTEISPSGEGLHIIVRADIAGSGHRNDIVEIYPQGRFFTMTGNVFQGRSAITERTAEVAALIQSIEAKRAAKRGAAAPPPVDISAQIVQTAEAPADVQTIIQRIRNSQQGAKFAALFDAGDTTPYITKNDPEGRSGADMALMNMLPFWTNGNMPLMMDIFSMSALGRREKWQTREDYRIRTAKKAIDSWNGKTYDPEALKKQRQEQDRFIRENGITKPAEELKRLATFRQNDTGNAERLELLYGDMLLHCTASDKWLRWDGMRWKSSESKDATELYNMVSATMRLTAMQYDVVFGPPKTQEEEDAKRSFLSFCKRSENQNSINNTIKRARALFPVSINDLDADPWLLNCENGTIDLKTGRLLPHDRAQRLTQVCAASYTPGARSELWESTVQQIIPDEGVRDYVQRFIGYCLTGLTREEKFLFLYGAGGGGKGTFIETIGKILGDYADTVPIDMLLAARNDAGTGNEPTPQLAKMAGKRLILTSESGQGRKFNDAKIKLLTGGDAITARFLRCEAFTFLPMFKIVMSSNFLPTVTNATDKGIKRRLIIVPFSAELDDIRDVTLKERLLYPQERSGILAWCVEGCLKWQREGLGEMPIPIKKMLSDYYAENDVIGEFISTYCNIGEDLRVKAKDLYKAFTEEMGYGIGWRGMKFSTFKEELRNRGFEPHKYNNGLHFLGIEFRAKYGYFNSL